MAGTCDQAGRLGAVYDSSAAGKVLDASYQHFAAGKPQQLSLGATPGATIMYHYKERDWLTNVNSSQY